MRLWEFIDIAIADPKRYHQLLDTLSEGELAELYWRHQEVQQELIDDTRLAEHMTVHSEDGLLQLSEWVVGQGADFYEDAMDDLSGVPRSAPVEGRFVRNVLYSTYKARFGNTDRLLDGPERWHADAEIDPTFIPRDVIASPLANGPRWAYAARLGTDLRAEFIRVGMRMVAHELKHVDDDVAAASHRAFLALQASSWLGMLHHPGVKWHWSRGFPEGVTADVDTVLALGASWVQKTPLLDLRVEGARPRLAELVARPWLQQIRALTLRDQELDDADVQLLVASPYLKQLSYLDLERNRIEPPGLDAIAQHFTELRYLGLSDNVVEDPAPELIVDQGVGDRLRANVDRIRT